MAERQSGTVKWFNDEKGFGFITRRVAPISSCTSGRHRRGKTGALFGRAEVRDAIDVKALRDAGYSRTRLLELAAQNEAAPNLDEYVSALARVGHHSDRQFAAYGLGTKASHAIREEFTEWHRELIDCMRAEAVSSDSPGRVATGAAEERDRWPTGPVAASPGPQLQQASWAIGTAAIVSRAGRPPSRARV